MSVGYDINVIITIDRITAKTVNIVLKTNPFPINFEAADLLRDISLIRIVPIPKSVKIIKKDRYAKVKLYLPNSVGPRYLARYIMTNKEIILKTRFPITMIPVLLATLRTVLN